MYSRYFIDQDLDDEIRTVITEIENGRSLYQERRDVFPSQTAPVIAKRENRMTLLRQRWGYPGVQGKGLVINARSESVREKRMFRNGIAHHRIVIPARGFYEWNQKKEKNIFSRPDDSVMYLAGFSDWFDQENRFVILTTAANESVAPIHNRMPLILAADQLEQWMDDQEYGELLYRTPCLLKRETEYEQLTLF